MERGNLNRTCNGGTKDGNAAPRWSRVGTVRDSAQTEHWEIRSCANYAKACSKPDTSAYDDRL